MTNREQVHSAFATIQCTMPPIAGIANGAMVLRDSTFETMSLSDWQMCVAPKVEGSLILDELFHTTPLDFFITFSSLAAVIGNMGQANYAAANAFMAALCAQRRDLRGVAGSSMDIGSVVGLGIAERSNVVGSEYFSRLGTRNLAETDLHQLFAEAIVAGQPGAGEASEVVTGVKSMYDDGLFSRSLSLHAGMDMTANSTSGWTDRGREEDVRGHVVLDPRFGHLIKEQAGWTDESAHIQHGSSAASTRSLLLKAQTFAQAERTIRGKLLSTKWRYPANDDGQTHW